MSTFVFTARGCKSGDPIRFMTGRHRRGKTRHYGAEHGFGRRAGRGDIRAAILSLLAEEPMHGYQIIQELAERTGGVWRPSPGSVYPTLQQLEDEELVRETAPESGKRVYELTDAGRDQAAATPAPWTAVSEESDDALVALRDLVHQVMAATRQVAHAGTAAQVEAAQQVLRDARRSLYRLLAGED
jgi:DNA-binding PadR family transcriptional regulator